MEKLGYIYSKNKLRDILDFVGVVNDSSLASPTKPLLIVGINNVIELCGDFSLSRKQIKENVFWTFGKTEKRVEYEKDLEKFYKTVLFDKTKNIKYYYFNFLTQPLSKIKNLINIINNKDTKYIYITNDMIYILYNDYILGISLKLMRYAKMNTEKVINKIKKNKANIIAYNLYFFPQSIRRMISTETYLLPYFMKLIKENKK